MYTESYFAKGSLAQNFADAVVVSELALILDNSVLEPDRYFLVYHFIADLIL